MKDLKASIAKSHAEKTKRLLGNGKHSDEREDRALVRKMVKPEAMTGKASGGAMKRADGGATRAKGGAAKDKKGGTKINVVVAPRGGGDRAGMPSASPMAAAPGAGPMPSRSLPPVAPPPVGPVGGLGALKGAGPVPGPIPAKKGGAIKRAAGGKVTGYDAGAGSGEGRLEKEEHITKIKGNAAQKAALRRP